MDGWSGVGYLVNNKDSSHILFGTIQTRHTVLLYVFCQ